MATAPQTSPMLLTAEEFAQRPDPGHPEELLRGRIVAMPPTSRRHGQVCANVVFLLSLFVRQHQLGHVLSNDAGVITRRGPDTVRGPDVAFYSFARLPKGPLERAYGPEVPELVVEVRSPHDRWRDVHEKVAEYLAAGVTAVLVLDPDTNSAHVIHADQPTRVLGPQDTLTLPDLLGDDFQVVVARFFE
jgi:Uma2 family endonuclease